MRHTRLALERPVTTVMVFLAVVAVGLISGRLLRLESMPDIMFPGMFVTIPYPGSTPEEIEPVMGAKPGSLGTVKGTIKNPDALAGIFADHAIRLVGNGTTGANKDGFHLRNVNVQRDLTVTRFGDFRRVLL